MRRLLLALLAALALVCAVPAAAGAHAVMTVDGTTLRFSDSDAGSTNTPTISQVGPGRVRFSDPTSDGGMSPGSARQCIPVNEREVECEMTGLTTIRVDVGPGNDRIAYRVTYRSQLVGREGNDVIEGGEGEDTAEGGDGADRVSGAGGRDALGGGADDDQLFGGAGPDVLQGGVGVDVADAGAGDDELRVRDGVADRALCGDGNDRVLADPADVAGVEEGCESVERAVPGSDADQGGTGDAIGAASSLRVRLGGLTRQRLRARRIVVAATATRPAVLTPTAVLTAAGRRVTLPGRRRSVAVNGGGVELTLPITARARSLARRALSAGRAVRVRVLVVGRDASGRRARRRMPAIALTR